MPQFEKVKCPKTGKISIKPKKAPAKPKKKPSTPKKSEEPKS